jgi:aspartyl-tRNA(Asn)/glutamyl-tRNA(Gln) amidotransferase subunit C
MVGLMGCGTVSGKAFGGDTARCYNLRDNRGLANGDCDLMPLTIADVQHIAELARLDLTPEEVGQYRDQLAEILDHAAVLQQVDTSAIPPTATVLPLRNVMRDDDVEPSLPQEDVLANAPDTADGYFKVHAILDVVE